MRCILFTELEERKGEGNADLSGDEDMGDDDDGDEDGGIGLDGRPLDKKSQRKAEKQAMKQARAEARAVSEMTSFCTFSMHSIPNYYMDATI